MSIASLLARQAARRGVGAAFQTPFSFRPPAPLFLSRCSASSLASGNASLASRLSSRIAATCMAPRAILGGQAAFASRGGLGLGLRLAARRAASNNLPAPKAATNTTLQRTASQHATMRLRRVAYIAGGVVVVGTLGYIAYSVSTYMASLNFRTVAFFGFYVGGITTAALFVAGLSVMRRFRGLSPELIQSEALRRIMHTPAAVQKLGGNVKPGAFNAFARRGGPTITMKPKSFPRFKFEPYGIQLLFQIQGDAASAMCSVDVETRSMSSYHYRSLALDFVDGERYVLAGNPEDVVFQGVTRLR